MKNIFLAFALMLMIGAAVAQPPKNAGTKGIPAQKFKPPKVTTSLGNHSDSVTVTAEEGKQLATLPLKIIDDKKNSYAIASYQCIYRKIGVTEDEQTGKLSPATSLVSDFFKSTPLPQIWVDNINDQLKSGEELYFFDVVAKDAQGHLFFAPNLKLKIK